jgi:hypothetical protein
MWPKENYMTKRITTEAQLLDLLDKVIEKKLS